MTLDPETAYWLAEKEKHRRMVESLQAFLPTKNRTEDEISALLQRPSEMLDSITDGNTRYIDELLAQQAIILDSVFHRMMRVSGEQADDKGVPRTDALQFAMRLQSQSSRTANSIREMHLKSQRYELDTRRTDHKFKDWTIRNREADWHR